jgi:hypothetical protein
MPIESVRNGLLEEPDQEQDDDDQGENATTDVHPSPPFSRGRLKERDVPKLQLIDTS